MGRNSAAATAEADPAKTEKATKAQLPYQGRTGQSMFLPLGQVGISGDNPRRAFDPKAMEELTESIRLHGVLEPIIVRLVEDPTASSPVYELIAGERRLRAAEAAGALSIPAIVFVLTDQEAAEVRREENLQREDLHPLDEAEGFRRLRDVHFLSLDFLAARVGKSKSYVHGRLKLCTLPDSAKKAWTEGKLTVSTALLIARIPNPALAEEATKAICEEHRFGRRSGSGVPEPMSHGKAAELVETTYMLALKDAPFKTGDADLVPGAGACSACPKRTGNARDLFGDIRSADVCTDPLCYQAKVKADTENKIAAAEASGRKVLAESDAKKIFVKSHYRSGGATLNYNSPYLKADEKDHDFALGLEGKSARTTFGKHLPEPTLAVDPVSGLAVELYRKEDVRAAALATGKVKKNSSGNYSSALDRARSAKAKRQAKLAAAQNRAVMEALVAAAEASPVAAKGPGTALWLPLALAASNRSWHEASVAIVSRRALSEKRSNPSGIMEKAIAKATPAEAFGYLIELLAMQSAQSYARRRNTPAIAAALGVNAASIEKKAASAFAASEKPKAKVGGKRKAKVVKKITVADKPTEADLAAERKRPRAGGGFRR